MARLVVYLEEQERTALYRLAELEYRAPKAQAALIIRKELQRLGLLPVQRMGDGKSAPCHTTPVLEKGYDHNH